MKRIIDGVQYLMRDTRPLAELRTLHHEYEWKFGVIDFHRWMAERGKVHVRIGGTKPPTRIKIAKGQTS